MESALRSTGLGPIGQQPWGTHFCLFYEGRDDLIELLIPYFKAGLENGEFCLCVASEPVIAEEVERALRQVMPDFERHLAEGQLEIVAHGDWYFAGGRFDPSRVGQAWINKLEQGLARGFTGMRFAANAAWLERKDWDRFAEYEAQVDEAFAKLPILAICAYCLTRCSSTDVLDVVRHHQFTVVRRHGSWERIEASELQRARAELRELNADLDRRVQERTAELAATNAQLQFQIAQRRHAEVVVRDNQQLLQSVLATLPVGVSVIDQAGDVVLVNEASKRIWGGLIVSGHDRRARSKGFYHESGKRIEPEGWASLRALREGQTTLNELIDIETYHGQNKTIQNSAAPIRNSEGSTVGAVVVNEDVTERVRAEEALRASERKRMEAQRLAHIGYWERDFVADRITWSKEADRIFGMPSADGLSETEFQSKIHPDDRQTQQQALSDALQSGRSYEVEFRVLRPDGEVRFVHVWNAIVRESSDRPIRIFGTVQDITERKIADEALRDTRDRLRHLTRRLLEVQEEERRHLARELHDEFGQLLATITLHVHAAKGVGGEVVQRHLDECMDLLQRAGAQVRSLALKLRPSTLDTTGLEVTLRWLAEQHQQRTGIATQVVGHVNGVSGDLAIACFRVAQEALTNVVRHSQAQHVWIELSQSERVLELAIRDDGVGFDVARTLEQAGGHRRLGLLGMGERVQILGGSLEVDSESGRGTRIRVTFPLRAAPTEHSNRRD